MNYFHIQSTPLGWLTAVAGVVLFALLLAGCSAPFDNPLDPRSDRYIAPIEPVVPPVFGFRVYTRHAAYSFPGDTYQVHAELWVEPPQLLDSAFVRYQNDRYYSLSGLIGGIWGRSFTESFFGDTLFQKVIGNPFWFLAYVNEQPDSFLLGPGRVVRLIAETPQVIFPDRQLETQGNPTLYWMDFDSTHQIVYPFGYVAEISDYNVIVWQSSLLSDTVLSVVVEDTLTDGDYYWTISVEDSFHNISRSMEASFTVVNPINQ